MGEVGTTKVFENDKIIVWEFTLEPGETTPVHTHKHDYIFYVLDGAPLEVFDADDQALRDPRQCLLRSAPAAPSRAARARDPPRRSS